MASIWKQAISVESTTAIHVDTAVAQLGHSHRPHDAGLAHRIAQRRRPADLHLAHHQGHPGAVRSGRLDLPTTGQMISDQTGL